MGAILALTSQALQQDCRQMSTGVLRVIAVAAMLIVMLVMSLQPMRASGLTFASWLLWLNYVGITLGSFSWFASAIAEEREQKTLGLLRMTGVHSAAILLGKWLPRLIVVQVLIIVQIPLAVLAVTMGGVTQYQLLAGYVALMAYAVMMSSVGLLWSVVCSHSRRAASGTLWFWALHVPGVALFKQFVTPNGFFSQIIPRWTGWKPWGWIGDLAENLHGMSLFRRLDSILAIGFGEDIIELQVMSNILIGIGAFAIGWFVFEYVTLYNLETPTKKRLDLLRPFRRKPKVEGVRRPKNVGRVWVRSIAWKEFFFSVGGWSHFFLKLVFYFGLALVIISIAAGAGMNFGDAWNEIAGGTFVACGMSGLVIESAGLVGRMFQAEIKSNTLTELMMLPVSVAQIACEKVLGVLIGLLPAASAVCMGCIVDPVDVGAELFESAFSMAGLTAFAGFMAFLHLSAWLSIHIRTGGLVLSFLGFWVASVLIQAIVFFVMQVTASENFLYTLIILIAIAFCVLMQYRIVKDLQKKGAA